MAAETYSDKNAIFRKLKAKSENKLLSFSEELGFRIPDLEGIRRILCLSFDLFYGCAFSADVLRLQCEEPHLGVRHIRGLSMYRLLRCPPQPWRAHQFCEVRLALFSRIRKF
ncbi:hypothetical protein ACLOJK_033880 [Asimina triloba]